MSVEKIKRLCCLRAVQSHPRISKISQVMDCSRKTILEESKDWKPVHKLVKKTSVEVKDTHKPGSTIHVNVMTSLYGGKEHIPVTIPSDAVVGQRIYFDAAWKIRPFVQYVVDSIVKSYQDCINSEIKKFGTFVDFDYFINNFDGSFEPFIATSDDEADLLSHKEMNFVADQVVKIMKKWVIDENISVDSETVDCDSD
jgi:hypothetical protein